MIFKSSLAGLKQLVPSFFTYGVPTLVFAFLVGMFVRQRTRYSIAKTTNAVLIAVSAAVLAGHAAEQSPSTATFSWFFAIVTFMVFVPLLGYLVNGGKWSTVRSEAAATIATLEKFRSMRHDELAKFRHENVADELGVSVHELHKMAEKPPQISPLEKPD